MQIVIEMSEGLYDGIRLRGFIDDLVNEKVADIIKNGTILPKEHGRLIDESKISKCEQMGLIIRDNKVIRCISTDAPTVIEVYKENCYADCN